jgi:hypothetical protein
MTDEQKKVPAVWPSWMLRHSGRSSMTWATRTCGDSWTCSKEAESAKPHGLTLRCTLTLVGFAERPGYYHRPPGCI